MAPDQGVTAKDGAGWLQFFRDLTARGLTTSPIPYGRRDFQIDFDFVEHVLWIRTSDGHSRQLTLAPKPVAEFHAELFAALAGLDIRVPIFTTPCEIADAIPFDQDTVHVPSAMNSPSRNIPIRTVIIAAKVVERLAPRLRHASEKSRRSLIRRCTRRGARRGRGARPRAG